MTLELAIKIGEVAECVKIIMYCQIIGMVCFIVGGFISFFASRN